MRKEGTVRVRVGVNLRSDGGGRHADGVMQEPRDCMRICKCLISFYIRWTSKS